VPQPRANATEDLSALLLATAAGDRAAFRRLYDATSAKMLGMAILLIRRRDAAEDALQDGYIRIWSNAHSYDPSRGPALPWLVRIIRNAVIDRMRRERAAHDDLDDLAETMAAAFSPPELRLDIQRALVTLTGDQRRAVILLYVHGLTCQEIAARLDAPVGTVKSWLRRGASRLSRYFEVNEYAAEIGSAA
jgi:RNA polymerase sigma-70 factor (ECF subfamily)